MRFVLRVVAALSLLMVGQASVAFGQAAEPASVTPPEIPERPPTDIPARRFTLQHTLVGSYNPLGLEYELKPGVQFRHGKSEDILFRDTFTLLGAYVRINPVASGIGPLIEWQPIAILNLRARAEVIGYYGAFGSLLSFPSPYSDYSDTAQRALDQAGQTYATWGVHAVLEPTLQAQVGPIAIQNRFALEYWNMHLRAGDTIWYDAGPDHALPGNGWTLQDEVNLVYLQGPWTAGLNFRYATPLWTEVQFRPGEDPHGVDDSNTRFGLLAAYTFFDNGYTAFNKPSIFVLASVWLHHRYRTGEDVSQAVPFVAAGFAFQQDFVF